MYVFALQVLYYEQESLIRLFISLYGQQKNGK